MNKTVKNNQDKNNATKDNNLKTKLIFKPYIARKLLSAGHKIVDIKPDHTNPIKTVFVFEDSLQLRDDMTKVIRERERSEFAEKKEVQTLED